FIDRTLVTQQYLPSLACGLRDRKPDFERRKSPAAVVGERLVVEYRVVQVLHFEETRTPATEHFDLAAAVVVIDIDAVRGLTHVAALETRHRHAEPADMGARACGLRVTAAAACFAPRIRAEAH